jgi:cobalt-zinc-cadmium efflux system membrane fusion protein
VSLFRRPAAAAGLGLIALASTACWRVQGSSEADTGAPPPASVEREADGAAFRVDRPERFPLVTATGVPAAPTVTATGIVSPDISRAVPVVSLGSGRVVDLRVRLGDYVEKGQLLMRIHSADAAAATADFRKAQTDDALARGQLERAQALFERGAIAKKDHEIAVDVAAKAQVDLENTAERLRVLGLDPAAPVTGGIIDVIAPASGVITEQNVTPAAGVKTLDNSPNLFTISDLSRVWIICDVYENDVSKVRVGDTSDIRVTAYPEVRLSGRVDNISAVLDPNLRTAKVRIEVANPGILRVGMFATASFLGQPTGVHAVVPSTAILHLHDREWVYVPARDRGGFLRKEITSGPMRPGNLQEVTSGVQPGERVVSNALVLQNAVEQ